MGLDRMCQSSLQTCTASADHVHRILSVVVAAHVRISHNELVPFGCLPAVYPQHGYQIQIHNLDSFCTVLGQL